MIRDRLKKAARAVALRAFGMEQDAADRAPTRSEVRPGEDISRYMPKIVDGDGDTPGPNHRELIGRTWLSAQVVSGVPGVLLDVRPAEEFAQGHLPGATAAPGWQIKLRPELVPDKGARITLYDAADGGLARDIAAWMRAEGWEVARALQGGWAEWLEHGELSERAAARVGDPVVLRDGRRGVIQSADGLGGLEVLLNAESGDFVRTSEGDLRA